MQTWRKRFGELFQFSFGLLIDSKRIGIRQLLNTNTDSRLAGVFKAAGVRFSPDLGPANILKLNDTRRGVLENNVVELFRRAETAHDADSDLKVLLRIRGLLPDGASGDLDVLLLQRADDIGCGKLASRELDRIEPQPHGIFALAEDPDIADAADALDGILDIEVEIVGDELLRVAVVIRVKPRG